MSTNLQMASTILLTVLKSNPSAGRRITNAHPSFAIRKARQQNCWWKGFALPVWNSQVIEKPKNKNWHGSAPAIFPFNKPVLVAIVINSASFEVWFAANTWFGVTKQHQFVTNKHCFVTNKVYFVTNKVCFVTNKHCFAAKQHSFPTKKLCFVAETLTNTNP